MSNFVKIVFVQLSHETGEIAVFKMLGKNVLCEFLVLLLCQLLSSDAAGSMLPPGPQSYRPHFPILQRFHLVDFPAFYEDKLV